MQDVVLLEVLPGDQPATALYPGLHDGLHGETIRHQRLQPRLRYGFVPQQCRSGRLIYPSREPQMNLQHLSCNLCTIIADFSSVFCRYEEHEGLCRVGDVVLGGLQGFLHPALSQSGSGILSGRTIPTCTWEKVEG